jgi:hypothetical protein
MMQNQLVPLDGIVLIFNGFLLFLVGTTIFNQNFVFSFLGFHYFFTKSTNPLQKSNLFHKLNYNYFIFCFKFRIFFLSFLKIIKLININLCLCFYFAFWVLWNFVDAQWWLFCFNHTEKNLDGVWCHFYLSLWFAFCAWFFLMTSFSNKRGLI